MQINWESFATYNHDIVGFGLSSKTCVVSYLLMRIFLEISSSGISMLIRIIMDWKQNLFMMKRTSDGLVFRQNFLIRMCIMNR